MKLNHHRTEYLYIHYPDLQTGGEKVIHTLVKYLKFNLCMPNETCRLSFLGILKKKNGINVPDNSVLFI